MSGPQITAAPNVCDNIRNTLVPEKMMMVSAAPSHKNDLQNNSNCSVEKTMTMSESEPPSVLLTHSKENVVLPVIGGDAAKSKDIIENGIGVLKENPASEVRAALSDDSSILEQSDTTESSKVSVISEPEKVVSTQNVDVDAIISPCDTVDETTTSENVSRENNTYDISHNSENQGVSDLTTDESIGSSSKENGATCDNQADIDPNSSSTEDSSESLGNDCYEAEDESEPRQQNNPEGNSPDSYNDQGNVEYEDSSLEDESSKSKACDDISVIDKCSELVESKPETVAVSILNETVKVSSPKISKKALHERSAFSNRIGSLRKNKKTNEEFSIEIFESKKPVNPNLLDQMGNQTGSTGCLTKAQMLRDREGRAQSEPPELKTSQTVPNFSVQSFLDATPTADGGPALSPTIGDSTVSNGGGTVVESNSDTASAGVESGVDKAGTMEGCTGSSSIEHGVSLTSSVGMDGSTTLSQTSESSSGVTGELTSTESPRKDSDPETLAEPPFGLGASAGATSLSETSGLDSDALARAEASSSGARGASDPEAEAGAGSGDGASSTGSEGRRAATAFTIELEKENNGEGSAKKLDIGGPLAKWAPKHRRNLSLTKVEENKVLENFFDENGNSRPRRRSTLSRLEKVDERGGGKPPVYRARSGTVGGASSPAAQGGLPRKPGGYHSEGYFSSDQDEDAPRKTDMRSPRSPRPPEVKSPLVGGAVGLPNGVSRSASQDFHRHSPTLRGRPASPDPVGAAPRRSSGPAGPITLNDSANFLIEKMINSTPETKRKTSVGTRPGDSARACCKGLEKKPSVADITGRSSRSSSDKGSKASTKIDSKKLESGSTHTNCQPFKVDRLADDSNRDEDEVSEAGTYTIDKDSSPELERARGDIERVFGLASAAAEGDGTLYSPAVPPPPLWDSQPGPDTYKTSPSISRNSPNWIQQWAAQVAEQTNAGDLSDPSKPGDSSLTSKSSLVSPRGSKMSMLPSVSGSQDSSDMLRPRRKLPTPPSLLQQSYPPGVSRAPDLDELEIMAKTRLVYAAGEEEDVVGASADHSSTADTQCFLRDTEHLLTSLQARVTDNTPITSSGGYRIASFESHDSGGDSDLDTSTSYAALHDDRPPAALRAKLKLSGLDSNSEKGLGGSSPRASNKHESSNSSHIKRERSNMSDGGYDPMAASGQLEEHSLQSDTSSDQSDLLKEQRKGNVNNPPLKYNRAFSLRRARLATEDTPSGSRQPPLTPTERRKQQQQQQQPVIRTSSSGGPLGVRRSPASRVGGLPSPDIRSSSSNIHQAVVKSPSRSSITKKEQSGMQRKHPGSRSNSTMSSKEVDFQNWKRRKNYDPMKAAMDGRKKQLEKKDSDKNMSGNVTSSDRGSPSPPGSLLRSASFHGTEGMMGGRWPRPTLGRYPHHSHNTYTSEDDGPVSYEDEQLVPAAPHASPLRRSPASPPHQGSGSPGHSAARRRRSSYAHSDDSEHLTSSPSRKISLDETGSEGMRSPLSVGGGVASSSASAAGGTRGAGPGQGGGGGRSRAKIEALDNLVISTIHSLSAKVRGTSENLLQKLKAQYSGEDRDRAELLQNVLNHLNSESESATSQIRSTSRDLSGILKNLKKIQTALEVIDQVMVVSGGDYDDLDDVDWPNNIGSDY